MVLILTDIGLDIREKQKPYGVGIIITTSDSSIVLINIPYFLKNLLCGDEGLRISGLTRNYLNRTMKTTSKVLWYNFDVETNFTLAALSTG